MAVMNDNSALKLYKNKLAYFLEDRYLSSEDSNFINLVTQDLELFIDKNSSTSVLLFPPVNNYLRLLIHKTVEEFPALKSFSIGVSPARQTVVCWKSALHRTVGGATEMSKNHPPPLMGRGRARPREGASPGQGTNKPAAGQSELYVNRAGTKQEEQQQGSNNDTGDINKVPEDASEKDYAYCVRPSPRSRFRRPDVKVYVPRGRRSQESATGPPRGQKQTERERSTKTTVQSTVQAEVVSVIKSQSSDISEATAEVVSVIKSQSSDISEATSEVVSVIKSQSSDISEATTEVVSVIKSQSSDISEAKVEATKITNVSRTDVEPADLGDKSDVAQQQILTPSDVPSAVDINIALNQDNDGKCCIPELGDTSCTVTSLATKPCSSCCQNIVECDLVKSANDSWHRDEKDNTLVVSGGDCQDNSCTGAREKDLCETALSVSEKHHDKDNYVSTSYASSGYTDPLARVENSTQKDVDVSTSDLTLVKSELNDSKDGSVAIETPVDECLTEVKGQVTRLEDLIVETVTASRDDDTETVETSDASKPVLQDSVEMLEEDVKESDEKPSVIGENQQELLLEKNKVDIAAEKESNSDDNDDVAVEKKEDEINEHEMVTSADGDELPADTNEECCRSDKKQGTSSMECEEISTTGFAADINIGQTIGSSGDEVDEDDWDAMFDEDGECLDEEAMKELAGIVGKVKIEKSKKIDYLAYQPKDKAEIEYSDYGHVIEIYDFPTTFVTRDLITAFQAYMNRGFDLKWVDDTHALGIFDSSIAAQDALSMAHPLLKVCSLQNASKQSKAKARRCVEFLQPYKERPKTTASAARRLVAGALGIQTNVPRETREKERQMLKEAKAKKRQDRKNKEDIWEFGKCAMDEER